jgi:hypothetical protein
MAKKNKKTDQQDLAPAPAAAGPREPLIIKRFSQKLPCPIDPNVVAARGRELAKVCEDREQERIARREAGAESREQIKFFDKRIKELSANVNQGTEAREVDCIQRVVFETQMVETVRVDNDKVLSSRPATSDDLQTKMPGADADAKAAAPKANGQPAANGHTNGAASHGDDADKKLFEGGETVPDDEGGKTIPPDAEWSVGSNPGPLP